MANACLALGRRTARHVALVRRQCRGGDSCGERCNLSGGEVAALTTAVQFGFVIGTALSAVLNLADVVPARRLFAAAAALGAIANAPMAFATTYPLLLASRFTAGVCLAGVYPPALKMAATWFRARRGLAVGAIVGALTIGKAGPYLLHALPDAGVALITLLASGSALTAALIVLAGYRDGPFAFESRPFSWSLVASVVRERRWRLATGGYLGHMAELYSYWTWIPAFVAASVARDPHALAAPSSPAIAVLSFGVIAVGGIGCIWGGLVADRIGRARLVTRALVVSGTCCAFCGTRVRPIAVDPRARRARLGVFHHRRFRAVQRARHGKRTSLMPWARRLRCKSRSASC